MNNIKKNLKNKNIYCFGLNSQDAFKKKLVIDISQWTKIVPLFYCPWSVSWLGVKAYHAHEGGQLRTAVDYYSRLIKRDPENLWAYESRSMAYYSLGEIEKSKEDDEKARAIESRLDESP